MIILNSKSELFDLDSIRDHHSTSKVKAKGGS